MGNEQAREYSFEEKCEYLANRIRQVLIADASNSVCDEAGEPLTGMALLKNRLTRMKRVQTAHDILKPVLDELNSEYDKLRKKTVPDLAQEQEIRTITIEGVGRMQLTGDCYASIPADQADAAYAWFRENNYGDLIKETVHSATLKAWAKEMIEQGRIGGDEKPTEASTETAAATLGIIVDGGPKKLPQGLFKIEPFTRASIVKVKGSK